MSNPILTNTNSKLDIRVKEPSGVVLPPTSGVVPGSPDRFNFLNCFENEKVKLFKQKVNFHVEKIN